MPPCSIVLILVIAALSMFHVPMWVSSSRLLSDGTESAQRARKRAAIQEMASENLRNSRLSSRISDSSVEKNRSSYISDGTESAQRARKRAAIRERATENLRNSRPSSRISESLIEKNRSFYLSDTLWKYSVDYSGFREAARRIRNGASNAICDIPPASAIIVYANEGLFPFILFQKQAMEIGGSFACLRNVLLVVCLDSGSFEACKANGFQHCTHLHLPLFMPRSEYAQGAYHYMTWIKHELMFESLKELDEVFLFDADVIFFKNPFPETRVGHDHVTGVS
jgi:hypothetical protein